LLNAIKGNAVSMNKTRDALLIPEMFQLKKWNICFILVCYRISVKIITEKHSFD
jgi:hypothetical protein